MRTSAILFIALAFCAGARAQAVTAAQLTTCKAALTALGFTPAGLTIFCPTNEAFDKLGDALGLPKGAGRADALLAAAKANSAVFKDILSFHAVKGVVPAAKVPVGTAVPTALAGAGNSVTVRRAARGGGLELAYPSAGGKMEMTPIVATDLTFEGPYGRTSTYVVHAIGGVMVPPSRAAAVASLVAAAKAPAAARPAVAAAAAPMATMAMEPKATMAMEPKATMAMEPKAMPCAGGRKML